MSKRKSNEQSLKEVISEILDKQGLGNKLAEKQLLASWPKVVGDAVARHTENLYISNSVLVVKLDSAVIREEVSYARSNLVEALNKEAGRPVINDILLA